MSLLPRALALLLFSTAVLARCTQNNTKLNLRPVIGVYAKPSTYVEYPDSEWTYVAASYIKAIEAAGARAVIVPWDTPLDNLTTLMRSLNGFFLPGGDGDFVEPDNSTLTPFGQSLKNIIDNVVRFNDEGTYYPLWGTCMGFQAIACMIAGESSGNYNCLFGVNGLGAARKNLHFFEGGENSRMYAKMTKDMKKAFHEDAITFFNAGSTVILDLWETNAGLKSNFTRLSYVYDQDGNQITSAIAGIKYPIYGSQFHSEKPTFEWNTKEDIPHSFEAIMAEQMYANFFVSEARRNFNSFNGSGLDLNKLMVYNYNAVTGISDSSFDQIYFLPRAQRGHTVHSHVHVDTETKAILAFLGF